MERMEMKPTQEQTEEFWEWCGLYKVLASDGKYHWFKGEEIVSPTDSNHIPIVNLDNLFKWAVPKLLAMGFQMAQPNIDYHVFIIVRKNDRIITVDETDKDPALAIFWAIWRAIKTQKR